MLSYCKSFLSLYTAPRYAPCFFFFCHFSFEHHSFEFNCAQETHVDGDPELLDDSEFYQQLLKEFFETIDPSSSGKQFLFG
jgi:hypothetical protein